ncbi:alpha-L-fucosidase-like [Oppia nitens]|uniref:alpha-L-fucosidase-like n=1 Tax=Oppia nitens TaxID=1686743 RepID=UPI0023DB580F|nr:alpha-L-fucosidase-like [Oppia nitens]
MKLLTILLFNLVNVLFISNTLSVTKYEPNWTSLDSRPLPDWFDDQKIGIFLHWGVFSVPSHINAWFWYSWKHDKSQAFIDFMTKNYRPDFTYADFAHQFSAEFYDPSRWAQIFKASGAKYVVLTSKHHEGYTLWPSKVSFNWNAKDVGPNRDLLGDLAIAVRKANIRFGVYHSLYEWFNPLYLEDKANNWTTNRFVTHKTMPELKELVNLYEPDVIWSDGDWEAPDSYWQSTDFLAWLYNDSPIKDKVVTNDRWGAGISCKHGGYFSCADRYNPGTLQPRKWENAMTIDRNAWTYRREAQLQDFLTPHELIATIVQTVSCGGNILVNVGPTHDGRIAPIFEERLQQMGQWLSINGEAIYGSKIWIHQNDTITHNIWYTTNSNKTAVYAVVLDWPQTGQVVLGSVKYSTVSSVTMLGTTTGALNYSEDSKTGSTRVTFPVVNPESGLLWAYVLKIIAN